MKDEKRKIISDICPFYKEYGTCEQCNTELDIDGEPCYFECMANAIINNGYSKQSEGEWIAKETMIRSPFARNYYCSACNYEPIEVKSYCPNCGAKMKGANDEKSNLPVSETLP